jgi:hypothetical protein
MTMSPRRPTEIALTVGSALVIAALGIIGPASAATSQPGPGDPCSTLHATTTDGSGNTMWCNPTMTGDHGLYWMYGGPV